MKSSQVIRRSAALVALSIAVGGGYAAAQKKAASPAPAAQPAPGKTDGAKSEMMSCPMEEAAPFADVTAENTADGAVVRLKAKKPADVQRIQKMAAMMAEHMTGGGMEHRGMMHRGMQHGGMMHGGMQHGRPGSSPQPAAQPKQPHAH